MKTPVSLSSLLAVAGESRQHLTELQSGFRSRLAAFRLHRSTEEQQKLRYQVPYVVWANYDIDEETGADTSANYLAAEVLERAGVPLDEYRSYLMHLKTEYPVISAVRTVKADGSEVRGSDEKDEMDIYRKLQYYELFDHGTVN